MVLDSSRTYVDNYGTNGDRMIDRLKELWNNPREIETGEWYLLLMTFMTLWMWMLMKG